jgi:hypothetical protein
MGETRRVEAKTERNGSVAMGTIGFDAYVAAIEQSENPWCPPDLRSAVRAPKLPTNLEGK